jgi:tellurite resistance protein
MEVEVMSKPPMNPDARSLEDAFFARETARLLDEMRKKAALEERRQALREVIKGADEALLDHLLDLGVNAQTVLALSMLPLVRVAWADGAIEAKERATLVKSVEERGVTRGTPAHELLSSWLEHKPDESIEAAWAKYIQGLWPSLKQHERDELRERLLRLARGVAEAAGGFLGLGSKISSAERAVLDEIETALR